MDQDIRTAAGYAAILVLSLLALWAGYELLQWLLPLLMQVSGLLINILLWCVSFVLILILSVATLATPLIVAACAVWLLTNIVEAIRKQFAQLRREMSAQARESATDAAFLAAVGIYAGMVFFMGTKDFLEPFEESAKQAGLQHNPSPHAGEAIRSIALLAAACSISKMLFLIPSRLVKLIAAIIPFTLVIGAIAIACRAYLADPSLSDLWTNLGHLSHVEVFVMVITIVLLFISLAYPFTVRGWRRMWRVEASTATV